MRTVTNDSGTCNGSGVLSEETVVAILETYMRSHGPTSEALLAAVLQSAHEAAIALARFQMVMQGSLIPELTPNGVAFRNAGSASALEPVGPIVRQDLAEVGA